MRKRGREVEAEKMAGEVASAEAGEKGEAWGRRGDQERGRGMDGVWL